MFFLNQSSRIFNIQYTQLVKFENNDVNSNNSEIELASSVKSVNFIIKVWEMNEKNMDKENLSSNLFQNAEEFN